MTVACPDVDCQQDIEVLDLLDFHEPVGCAHSAHGRDRDWHDDGPATHYVKAYHKCAARPELQPPFVYPACASFVEFVGWISGRIWQCKRCGVRAVGGDTFSVLCPVAE